MAKTLIVFVKNKLITIDTILPVLVELKKVYDVESNIIVLDSLAHKGISENIVIRDAIHYIGKEIYITSGYKNRFLRKFSSVYFLVEIVFKVMFGAKILHFGVLDQSPLNVIGKIFRKNVFLLKGLSFEHHTHDKCDFAFKRGGTLVHNTPVGANIVLFKINEDNNMYTSLNKKIYNFGGTRTRKEWISYIYNDKDKYFKRFHPSVDFSKGAIVFALPYFGHLGGVRDKNSILNIFVKTIDSLHKLRCGIPILMKPHVITDMNVVKEAIKNYDGFYITYLHPTLLAMKSRMFICNYYSMVMADSNFLGVKTIEYSDYSSDLLEATDGGSFGKEYIDYFINNDRYLLESTIKHVLSQPYEAYSNLNDMCSNDPSGLLIELSK